jgi:hypothetical protein
LYDIADHAKEAGEDDGGDLDGEAAAARLQQLLPAGNWSEIESCPISHLHAVYFEENRD